MKLKQISVVMTLVILTCASCVKNKPFIQPYSVPPTYNFSQPDSSATASLIMMHAIQNYLATSTSTRLQQALFDSLWLNRDSSFTEAMVDNFIYQDTTLNKMQDVNLASATADADSIKAFGDLVVADSRYYNRPAREGVAGWRTQSGASSTKKLFSNEGVEFGEVWYISMLGAMAMNNALSQLSSSGTSAGQAWNLAYNYIGLPYDYDPAFDYNAGPVRPDRPLGFSTLFTGAARSINAGKNIYDAFRRGRAAVDVGDLRVGNGAVNTIASHIEGTLVLTGVSALDAAMQSKDVAAQLHHLSTFYGIVWALKGRPSDAQLLEEEAYWNLRKIAESNFYTLIGDDDYTQIKKAKKILEDAYASE